MHNLLKKSKIVKAQADKILQKSGILDILQQYGEVKIGGSYALDVMLRPDLDIFVVAEKHNWNTLLKIQREIMELKYFREFDFVNWVDFRSSDVDFMPGYYFRPWVLIGNELWKIDIWFITANEDKTEEFVNRFKNAIDDSKRSIILTIKDAVKQGRKYIKGIDGKLIYEAVLEKGISSIEDFKRQYNNGK